MTWVPSSPSPATIPLCSINFFVIVSLLSKLLKCPQPPFEFSPLAQTPSSALPESLSSQGRPTVAPAPLTSSALHMGSPTGSVWMAQLSISQHTSEPTSCLHPCLPFASPLMPEATSSASAFCFPRKWWFNSSVFIAFISKNSTDFFVLFCCGTSFHSVSCSLFHGCYCLLYLFEFLKRYLVRKPT